MTRIRISCVASRGVFRVPEHAQRQVVNRRLERDHDALEAVTVSVTCASDEGLEILSHAVAASASRARL